MSSSSSLCNIVIQDADLKKLEQLDPNQNDGFKTFAKLVIPVRIIYTNELGDSVEDVQNLTAQILVRMVKGSAMQRHAQVLQTLRIYLTSEVDLYFNFVSNCTQQTFQSLKNKNGLNIEFNNLPNVFASMLTHTSQNQIHLNLSYEGTGKLQIFQRTQYKRLQLLELYFIRGSIQKAHQSIVYRFNYQKAKLAMLQNSISSIYEILQKKNISLLHYIRDNVGINQ